MSSTTGLKPSGASCRARLMRDSSCTARAAAMLAGAAASPLCDAALLRRLQGRPECLQCKSSSLANPVRNWERLRKALAVSGEPTRGTGSPRAARTGEGSSDAWPLASRFGLWDSPPAWVCAGAGRAEEVQSTQCECRGGSEQCARIVITRGAAAHRRSARCRPERAGRWCESKRTGSLPAVPARGTDDAVSRKKPSLIIRLHMLAQGRPVLPIATGRRSSAGGALLSCDALIARASSAVARSRNTGMPCALHFPLLTGLPPHRRHCPHLPRAVCCLPASADVLPVRCATIGCQCCCSCATGLPAPAREGTAGGEALPWHGVAWRGTAATAHGGAGH